MPLFSSKERIGSGIMREFFVETPLGKLRIWAKHETDTPEDFPGVYVDIIHNVNGEEESDLLCCVEYDSCQHRLQTCVYDIGCDDPLEVVKYSITETVQVEKE